MPKQGFIKAYQEYAEKQGLNPDPYNPEHYYDYESLYEDRGGFFPDEAGHLPSKYKLEGHPRMFLDGINTKTGVSMSNNNTTPDSFKEFMQMYQQAQQPSKPIEANPPSGVTPNTSIWEKIGTGMEGLGAGMAGFAAPFLGQQWTNPYAKPKSDPYQMLMMRSLLGQQKEERVEGRVSERESKQLGFKLREEFIKLPEVKDYQEVKTQTKIMDSLLGSALKGDQKSLIAIDQGLINTYNKILDPMSVVRESEYVRTPEGMAFAKRLEGAYKKLGMGGAGLTNTDRQSLVEGAKLIANQRGQAYSDAYSRYKDYSKELEIPDEYFIKGFEPHSDFEIGSVKDSKTPQLENQSGVQNIGGYQVRIKK